MPDSFEFVQGIKSLADSIEEMYPGRVGNPLQNEWYYTIVDDGGNPHRFAKQYTEAGYFEHVFEVNRTYFYEDDGEVFSWQG